MCVFLYLNSCYLFSAYKSHFLSCRKKIPLSVKKTVGLELRNIYSIYGSAGCFINDFEKVILPLGLSFLVSQGLHSGRRR